MMLEMVAVVPGMVGVMLLHCKSLRRFEHSGGWIKALLEEAENERMHLMTFMGAAMVGESNCDYRARHILQYLFLSELDKGQFENVPTPAIVNDYWRLPAGSILRDVVMVVRTDEAHLSDVNHFASE
ncbi:hypothetical protein GIB67_013594 [Kingdonia uniflora]|uniref:Ubiquinol oxidase n=1 Tax=Kingdonia uniflora TaxID=39325 RepID=A0A7J7KV37_9MAGN|nr:hypothetical protein GIB67_013594 [Kingdonia uniflora]